MTRPAALVMLLANALVTAALLAAYAHWIAPAQTPRLAVIDVGALYRLMEARATTRLTRPDSTPEERAAVLKDVGSFATELSRQLQELPQQCHCIVLVRGAVAAMPSDLLDLTPQLRQQLGL